MHLYSLPTSIDSPSSKAVGWQPQAYNVSAADARGPYGKSAQVENVVINPLANRWDWGGEGINGDSPGLQVWVDSAANLTSDGSGGQMIKMGEIDSLRNDIMYGSFRIGMKMSTVSGTCAAFFWVRLSQSFSSFAGPRLRSPPKADEPPVQEQYTRDRPRVPLPPSNGEQQLVLPEPRHPIPPQRSSKLQRRTNLNLRPAPSALPPRRRLPRIPLRLDPNTNLLLRRRRLPCELRPIRPQRARLTDAQPLEQRRPELERQATSLGRRADSQLHQSVLQH